MLLKGLIVLVMLVIFFGMWAVFWKIAKEIGEGK